MLVLLIHGTEGAKSSKGEAAGAGETEGPAQAVDGANASCCVATDGANASCAVDGANASCEVDGANPVLEVLGAKAAAKGSTGAADTEAVNAGAAVPPGKDGMKGSLAKGSAIPDRVLGCAAGMGRSRRSAGAAAAAVGGRF